MTVLTILSPDEIKLFEEPPKFTASDRWKRREPRRDVGGAGSDGRTIGLCLILPHRQTGWQTGCRETCDAITLRYVT